MLEGLLAGRPGPVEFAWNPKELWDAGVRVIVSLNTEPDPTELAAVGLRHHSLPLAPTLPLVRPVQARLLRGVEKVLPVIYTKVRSGNPTLVHCHAGKDRTGLMLAAYLVRYHGLEVDKAVERVRAVKPTAMSAPGYEPMARRFAEQEAREDDAQG